MIVLLILLVLAYAPAGAFGLSIEGQILGPDGQGLAGARVEARPVLRVYDQGIRDLEGKGQPEPAAQGLTDMDGWYRLAIPSEGPWRVMVTADGFAAMDSGPRMVLGEDAIVPLRMGTTMSAASVWQPLRARTAWKPVDSRQWRLEISDRGKPVPGALIRDSASGVVIGRTGKDGALVTAGPKAGGWEVRVETRDGRLVSFPLPRIPARARPEDKAFMKILLPPPVALTGRVVEQSTGRPVPEARVWPEEDPAAFQVADAQGMYRLPVWAAKTWVGLTAGGDGRFVSSERFFPEESRTTAPTLVLWPSRSLSGTVVDEDGNPVEQAEVRVFAAGSTDETARVRTSPLGRFRVSHLPEAGSLELLAYRTGMAPAMLGVTLEEAGDSEPVLVLGRGRTARGRIVDEKGEPIADAQVDLMRSAASTILTYKAASDNGLYRAVSDEDGRFEVTGLPERWFDLVVSRDNFFSLTLRALDLGKDGEDGKAADLGTLTIRRVPEDFARMATSSDGFAETVDKPASEGAPAVTLTGRVLTPDGSPAPGAAVVWIGAGRRRNVADGDGRYEIEDLKPGNCMILARHDTFGRRTVPSVDLLPGENRLDVTLEPMKPPREIRGRVLDPEGHPVEGARVENNPEGFAAFTRADGSFTLKTDQSGFDLRVRKPGYAPLRLLDTAEDFDDDEVELRLGREVFLSGRILGLDPDDLVWVEVSASSEDGHRPGGVGQDGVYRIPGLEPGTWEVVAALGDRLAVGHVVIAPGEEEPVVDLIFDPEPEQP